MSDKFTLELGNRALILRMYVREIMSNLHWMPSWNRHFNTAQVIELLLFWQSRQLWQPVKAISHLLFCQCRWNWARPTQMPWHKAWGSHPLPHSQRHSQDPHAPLQAIPTCVWNEICRSQFKEQPLWLSLSPLSPTHGSCGQRTETREELLTAIVFSLIPPTGRIFPVNDTSPVMATFCLTGQFMARDSRAVTMVHPALGPSFGVAPCSKKQSTTPLLIQEAA